MLYSPSRTGGRGRVGSVYDLLVDEKPSEGDKRR